MSGDMTGARLLVQNLERQGVKYVFGIPGAKIDAVFEALLDSSIELVVCRHEQNAAFIAQGIGRLTGKAGVCLVTSGPGCGNLITGFATANSEGAPVVGFGGAVPRKDLLKLAHQSLDTVSLFKPVTRFSAQVDTPDSIGEIVANAFRAAESGRRGAAFVSLPQDVTFGAASGEPVTPVHPPRPGCASDEAIAEAVKLISGAEKPVLLLGMMASRPDAAAAVRALIGAVPLPVVSTFQANGVVPRENLASFGGRVGLFHNQPADQLLDAADLVVAVGFNPIEYDPVLWNAGRDRSIVHIDSVIADYDAHYSPDVEVYGDISASLDAIGSGLSGAKIVPSPLIGAVRSELEEMRTAGSAKTGMPVHPLRIIKELEALMSDDIVMALDMGSFHIWIARYLYAFVPEQFLISNGQQTLGVALPWAIAACLARPDKTVISVSGDGGFHFSSQELETAVRLKCNFVHIIWTDGGYNMVEFQEVMKYGHSAGVAFGPIDTVKFAEAHGAVGYRISDPDQIGPTLRKALETPGPVLVDIPVDYRDNIKLGEAMHKGVVI
jgi:acetolactate synthase-1/2/3 large subunit